ncbi:hypothetical protein [Streptomyces sp. NPDC059009]|uniref:hypothetical protein n=1 Tax=Streptomyces sp. NPDC059009 TaxID=3346694 RepID=UPI00367BEFF9
MDERTVRDGVRDRQPWRIREFERDEPRLRALAQRFLGSPEAADAALTTARERLGRETGLDLWLTAEVGRACVRRLRVRGAAGQREPGPGAGAEADSEVGPQAGPGPEAGPWTGLGSEAGPWTGPGPEAGFRTGPGPEVGSEVGSGREAGAGRDSFVLALFVVLETLPAPERLAFLLHDLFAVALDDAAAMLGRTPAATYALVEGARRRLRGGVPGTR